MDIIQVPVSSLDGGRNPTGVIIQIRAGFKEINPDIVVCLDVVIPRVFLPRC